MTPDLQDFELIPAEGLHLSYTSIRDWTMLHPELRGTPFQLYAIMRSLVIDKAGGQQPSRRITLDQLCWLLPGVNGKPTSLTAVKDALRILDRFGLVTNPDGERLVTSAGKGSVESRRRFQINDQPPNGFRGWRNAWDKLDDYREDWRANPAQPPAIGSGPAARKTVGSNRNHGPESSPTENEHAFEGRNSDLRTDQAEQDETAGRFDGRNSAHDGRNSAHDGRNSAHRVASDQPKRAPKKSLKEGSLSLVTSASPDAATTMRGERDGFEDQPPADPSDAIVQAWTKACGSSVPPLAPDTVRRSARELLAEGVDAGLLCQAAANMAPRGWTDLRKHLERWTPPNQVAPNTTPIDGIQTAADCRWCDDYGWFQLENGRQSRCKHPEQPPAGHPAANHVESVP